MNDEFYVGPGVHLHHEDRVGAEIAAAEEPSFAAWTTPITHATGDVFPASDWNTYIRDNLNYLFSGRSYTKLYHSAVQSLTTSVAAILALDSEEADRENLHDPVTNNSRITIVTVGVYIAFTNIEFVANATGTRQVSILMTGSRVASAARPAATGTNTTKVEAILIRDLAAASYLQIEAYQDSGGALSVVAAASGGSIIETPALAAVMVG